ncbi:MAG: hypothetical protein ACLFWI_24235, partial [Coleofasciculus sp.]
MQKKAKQHLVSPVQKKRSIRWLPRAKKAKHPLASPMEQKAKHPLVSPCNKREASSGLPVQQTRSILWSP